MLALPHRYMYRYMCSANFQVCTVLLRCAFYVLRKNASTSLANEHFSWYVSLSVFTLIPFTCVRINCCPYKVMLSAAVARQLKHTYQKCRHHTNLITCKSQFEVLNYKLVVQPHIAYVTLYRKEFVQRLTMLLSHSALQFLFAFLFLPVHTCFLPALSMLLEFVICILLHGYCYMLFMWQVHLSAVIFCRSGRPVNPLHVSYEMSLLSCPKVLIQSNTVHIAKINSNDQIYREPVSVANREQAKRKTPRRLFSTWPLSPRRWSHHKSSLLNKSCSRSR